MFFFHDLVYYNCSDALPRSGFKPITFVILSTRSKHQINKLPVTD